MNDFSHSQSFMKTLNFKKIWNKENKFLKTTTKKNKQTVIPKQGRLKRCYQVRINKNITQISLHIFGYISIK